MTRHNEVAPVSLEVAHSLQKSIRATDHNQNFDGCEWKKRWEAWLESF